MFNNHLETVRKHSYRLPPKAIFNIIIFIIVFGIFVATVSGLMNRYFNPASNAYVQEFLRHQDQALIFYFVYVVVASIIVPLPTLPVDVILLTVINPWMIIAVRLIAGLVGSTFSFYLSRAYGRPLLKRWLSEKNYDFVEQVSEDLSWKQFFIVAMIPIINTELMAYAGGISRIRYRQLIVTLAIADFYRLLFVFFVIKA